MAKKVVWKRLKGNLRDLPIRDKHGGMVRVFGHNEQPYPRCAIICQAYPEGADVFCQIRPRGGYWEYTLVPYLPLTEVVNLIQPFTEPPQC